MRLKLILAILASLYVATLIGCHQSPLPLTLVEGQGPARGFAPFPVDRAAAASIDLVKEGRDAQERSPGAVESGASLVLSAGSGEVAWAIYCFTPVEPFVLASVNITLGPMGDTAAWIGLADFTSGRWHFAGPYPTTKRLPLETSRHVSPNGNIYIAVACGAGQNARIATIALQAAGSGWHITDPNPASNGDVGGSSSLAVVNGFPAISYLDMSNQTPMYVRAIDADGLNWGTPRALDYRRTVVAFTTSLKVINGAPAVCYNDFGPPETHRNLMYVRALDADGTEWGPWQVVDEAGDVGQYASLAEVDGRPAISYQDYGNNTLKYVRANDASGNAWGTPIVVDSVDITGVHTCLAVVNGNPAISYGTISLAASDKLRYVRATNPAGSSWGSPLTVASTGNSTRATSLVVVEGHPAIAYLRDFSTAELMFVRALDPNGESWGEPLALDAVGQHVPRCSMAVIGGVPAISYQDNTDSDLKYIQASIPDGSAWDAPQALDTEGYVGSDPSLGEVNGNAAISYEDGSNRDLKYIKRF